MKYLLSILIFFSFMSAASAETCTIAISDKIITKEEFAAEVYSRCNRNEIMRLNHYNDEKASMYLATYLCNFNKEILTTDGQLICILK